MDTVILKIIGRENFKIMDRSLFWPIIISRSYEDLTPVEQASVAYKLRTFRLQVEQKGDYVPKVEVSERLSKNKKIFYELKIEFSAPKLVYWNSLQEVTEKDFHKILSALNRSLERQQVFVDLKALKNADVVSVHVCKNVLLPREIRMRNIINELSKLNISKAYDVSLKQHKKGGRVLSFYAGTIEWSFYDKVSDAFKPKNKRIDKGHILFERLIIEQHGLETREVFRYEHRIKRAQTVRSKLNPILNRDLKAKVTFEDLFTPGLITVLALDSWGKAMTLPENQISLFAPTDPLKLVLHMLRKMKEIKPNAYGRNDALTSFGLAMAIRECGAKELRGCISDLWNTDHPERLNEKIKLAATLVGDLPYSSDITYIDTEIKKFEIITKQRLEYGI